MSTPTDALRAKQEAHLAAVQAAQDAAANTAKVAEHTYYSNVAGAKYYFANGDIAEFVSGEYVTNRDFEIKELDALVKQRGNHMFYDQKVPIQNQSDALILTDVGKSGGGTGMVGSTALAALRRQS